MLALVAHVMANFLPHVRLQCRTGSNRGSEMTAGQLPVLEVGCGASTNATQTSGTSLPCSLAVEPEMKAVAQLTGPRQLSLAAFLALFTVCTVTYSMYTLLLHLCDTDSQGNYHWLTGSVVMLTELSKLGLSLALLGGQRCLGHLSADEAQSPPVKLPRGAAEILPYGVPAMLYALNNNLDAYIQLQMDSVSFQILSNLKILTTALLFRLIMRREISGVQWLALGLLFAAGVSNSLAGLAESAQTPGKLYVTPAGLVMMLIYCTVSALAGVYTEYVLKRQAATSVHLQNSLLYVFGIVLNFLVFVAQAGVYNKDLSLLKGFTGLTWAVVVSQTLNGVSMGMLMKFSSNITKLFVVSTAMLLTTVASVLLFNFSVNIFCAFSFVCVVVSQFMYYNNGCGLVCSAN